MKTKLREMVPEDVPAVLEKLKEQNERDGTSYGLPAIFDVQGKRLSNIPLALVAVDVETGQVEQGHVWQTTVTLEQMAFGTSADATVCSMHEHAAVFWMLMQKGFTDVHIFVPKQRVKDMAHGLKSILGMNRTGMEHFYRLLDPTENMWLRYFYEEQETRN